MKVPSAVAKCYTWAGFSDMHQAVAAGLLASPARFERQWWIEFAQRAQFDRQSLSELIGMIAFVRRLSIEMCIHTTISSSVIYWRVSNLC